MESNDTPKEDHYEAPRVEHVLTSEELEREVQYAGTPSEVDDNLVG